MLVVTSLLFSSAPCNRGRVGGHEKAAENEFATIELSAMHDIVLMLINIRPDSFNGRLRGVLGLHEFNSVVVSLYVYDIGAEIVCRT